MTMPILTSSPTLAHSSSTQESAGKNSTDSNFSDLLSNSRQSLDAQNTEQELPAAQGRNDKQQESEDDAKTSGLELTLPELALAIATQAAHLRQAADTTAQTNSLPSGKSLNDTTRSTAENQTLDSETKPSTLVTQPTRNQGEEISSTPAAKLQDVLLGVAPIRASEPAKLHVPGATKLARNISSMDTSAVSSRNALDRQNQTGAQTNTIRAEAISDLATPLSAPAENTFSALMSTEQGPHQLSAGMQPSISMAPTLSFNSAGVNSLPGIGLPLQHPHWPQAMSQQFLQLLPANDKQGIQTAELRLDPPELGPLRISIQISDNVAHAMFVSAHVSVRQALEQAMPQLQEQLEQAGLSLGQTSVSDQSSQQTDFAQQQKSQQSSPSLAASGSNSHAEPQIETPQRAVSSNALVDTFA